MAKRKEIRDRFGIKGSRASDCCASYWCPCCSLIQHDNEVKTRLGDKTMSKGYQVSPIMEMPQRDIYPRVETSPETHGPSNTPMVGET